MASTKEQTVYTFSTTSGSQTYRYDIVVDSFGRISVRNLRSPRGLITDAFTSLPDVVIQDIAEAKSLVAQSGAEAEVVSGTITFAGETILPAAIAPGLLNTADYRVTYTTVDGMLLWTSGQTTTGFFVESPSAYGTVLAPKTVDYSVLTTSASGSAFGGFATVTEVGGGEATITFPIPMVTTAYRVVLSPVGAFPVVVTSKTKLSFTIQVGYTLAVGESLTVGFDVFV